MLHINIEFSDKERYKLTFRDAYTVEGFNCSLLGESGLN